MMSFLKWIEYVVSIISQIFTNLLTINVEVNRLIELFSSAYMKWAKEIKQTCKMDFDSVALWCRQTP